MASLAPSTTTSTSTTTTAAVVAACGVVALVAHGVGEWARRREAEAARRRAAEVERRAGESLGGVATTWREDEGDAVLEPLTTLPKKFASPDDVPEISETELKRHDKPSDCWFVVHGFVYDASKFADKHPGGWLAMSRFAGASDCSDEFEAYHPSRVHRTLLPSMLIGRLASVPGAPASKEDPIDTKLRAVRQTALKAGLFKTSKAYYVKRITILACQWVSAVALTLNPKTWKLGAVAMGMFWQQLAFIGHDVGHNAVSQNRLSDLWWGIVGGNTMMGISLGWWKMSHNVHHLNCNSVEHDPDIQHMPVFAVSERLFRDKFFSTYHNKTFVLDALSRLLVSFQHVLFYPVMAVARVNLYIQSWAMLLLQKQGRTQFRFTEMVTMALFPAWVAALTSRLPAPTSRNALVWVSLAHAVAGLLHVQICISHFPMDVFRDGDASRKRGFFAVQLQTTLNVDNHPELDWLHGGLQFQIEHHLFPRMPRHNLRAARQLVLEALTPTELANEYHELPFVSANLELLRSMREAAQQAWVAKRGDGGFYHSALYEGVNALG